MRWRTAAEDLIDHWENVHDSSDPVSWTGHFTAIGRPTGAVRSKRLVILGKAGAGKTVSPTASFSTCSTPPGRLVRLPVLVSLGDWAPDGSRCRLVGQLVHDSPFSGGAGSDHGHEAG